MSARGALGNASNVCLGTVRNTNEPQDKLRNGKKGQARLRNLTERLRKAKKC